MRKRLMATVLVCMAQLVATSALGQDAQDPTSAPNATPTATTAPAPAATAAPTLATTVVSPDYGNVARETRFEISAVFSHSLHSLHEVGLRTTTTPVGWKAGVAADLYQQSGDLYYLYVSNGGPAIGHLDRLLEMDLGGRLSFTDSGAVRPWFGGGAGVFSVEGKLIPGIWVGSGVDLIVAKKINLGLLLHYASAHSPDFFDSNGEGIELGSTTVGASAGLVF